MEAKDDNEVLLKDNYWKLITFVLVGVIFYIISCLISCDFWSNALSGIGLSCVAGAIVSVSLDFPNALKRYKQSIIDTLTSNDYLAKVDQDKLSRLRDDITTTLYLNSNKVDTGLIKLDQEICSLLQKPFYEWYRQTIKCEEDSIKKRFVKHVEVEYEIRNPCGGRMQEDIGLTLSADSVVNCLIGNCLKIKSMKYSVDGLEFEHMDQFYNFVEEFDSKKDDNYTYRIRVSRQLEKYIPFEISYANSLIVKITYETIVSINDVVFTKRLRYATKSFILNYAIDNEDRVLHGELIGTLMTPNDYSIIGNRSNLIAVESRKWLLPKNGAVIIITPKNNM